MGIWRRLLSRERGLTKPFSLCWIEDFPASEKSRNVKALRLRLPVWFRDHWGRRRPLWRVPG